MIVLPCGQEHLHSSSLHFCLSEHVSTVLQTKAHLSSSHLILMTKNYEIRL